MENQDLALGGLNLFIHSFDQCLFFFNLKNILLYSNLCFHLSQCLLSTRPDLSCVFYCLVRRQAMLCVGVAVRGIYGWGVTQPAGMGGKG